MPTNAANQNQARNGVLSSTGRSSGALQPRAALTSGHGAGGQEVRELSFLKMFLLMVTSCFSGTQNVLTGSYRTTSRPDRPGRMGVGSVKC